MNASDIIHQVLYGVGMICFVVVVFAATGLIKPTDKE